MDQVKIGKFIAERRKAANLTQADVGERLGLTDRAISKWERGKALPDASVMIPLCDILGITVTDLLSGEVVSGEALMSANEHNTLSLVAAKERADRLLLSAEIIIIILSMLPFFAALAIVFFIQMEEWLGAVIVLGSLIPLLACLPFVLKLEQRAGYYECGGCGHRYVPSYASVLFAQHIGLKRRMRCPLCGRKTWHKKILSEVIDE